MASYEKQSRRVAFAGDWHSNAVWAEMALNSIAAAGIDTVYHLGDFGIWPNDHKYLFRLNRLAENHGLRVLITPGNHEDWNRIDEMARTSDGLLRVSAKTPALAVIPRGHVFEDHGVRFASLGGAGSIDRNLRTINRSWWPNEEILDVHVDELISNANSKWDDGQVDVFLAHDAPSFVRLAGYPGRPYWLTREVLDSCEIQRVRISRAVDAVRPKWFLHGHWHQYHRQQFLVDPQDGRGQFETQVIGLNKDDQSNNVLVGELTPGGGLANIEILNVRGSSSEPIK